MNEQLEALEHMFPECTVDISLPLVSLFINNDKSRYESSAVFNVSLSNSAEESNDLLINSAEIQSTILSFDDCRLLTKELMDIIKADPTDLIAAAVFAYGKLVSKLESTNRNSANKAALASEQSKCPTMCESAPCIDDYWLKERCILKSSTIKSKKSVFFAHTAHVLTIEDVDQLCTFLKNTQGIDDATHNIVAYRLCSTRDPSDLQEGFDDDGEHAAGGRLLLLMQKMKVYNRIAIVTRYFGGIPLGPARFKHINDCAQEIILEAKGLDPNFCSGL
ncbi:Impact-like protein [Giardia lamblia P15]|uniref:Impact-like protein n=1 Tax=Giardia intestinalis (strain P15) TaxID=658858 RepID=E1F3N0_GIAIA|nr:Impact-like protein [Giardia lamblia P15]